MKTYGVVYKHIKSGIIARETGVDSTSWMIIESYHLNNTQPLHVLTIPSFIFNTLDWEEIHVPYENSMYRNYIDEAILLNSKIFQDNKDLFFLIK